MKKHYTLYNIGKLLILSCVLLLGGTEVAMGQIQDEGITPDNTIEEILYVVPNQNIEVRTQDDGDNTGMYGYIRWSVEDANGNKTINGISNDNLTKYTNGLATTSTGTTGSAGYVTCNFTQAQVNADTKLVYEASSVRAETGSSGRDRYIRPRAIGIRHVFKIKDASERVDALREKQSALEELGIRENNLEPLREASDPSKYVLNAYDIYLPAGATSNFRLPEELRNYFVPNGNRSAQALYVRWTINRYDGRTWTTATPSIGNNGSNITEVSFNNNTTRACILAEVSNSRNGEWYPVSFLNISLEKRAGAMTKEALNNLSEAEKNAYKHRFEDELLGNTALYQRIEHISFEKENEILTGNVESYLRSNLTENFTSKPFTTEDGKAIDSYYAFAHPEMHAYRGNELKVMKGEYALYRTLNYPEISRASTSTTKPSQGATEVNGAYYTDYFPQQYNRRVTDRLWEKTNGSESGYFMYIDASEIPGVIAKIPISGLCPNTSLIVNAWVCDVTEGNGRTPANIGFTLKGKDKDSGTETILAKYYSGALSTADDGTTAQWQQVSFKFSFSNTEIGTSDEFVLEISSNCESSNGADFGIDEISVFKTLPAITSQREDACESSVLMVSTDYQTLQSNMTWDIDLHAIDENELSNPDYRKYRYGLMGNDPYAPVDDILHSNVGNVYFAFTEKESNGKVGNWIVLNKDLTSNPELSDLGLQYTMRVAVQTDMNSVGVDGPMIPDNPEDAKRSEIIMNIRAMNDFLEDVKRDYWKDHADDGHVKELEQLIGELCVLEPSTGSEADGAEDPKRIKDDSFKTDAIISNAAVTINGVEKRLGDEYEKAVVELYACLEIPRIRCPWRSEDNTILYLSEIDVHNTDLRFAGEKYKDGDEEKVASGEYYVVLFSARQIATANGEEEQVLDLDSECALKNTIYVMPSTTIAVQTETDDNVIACVGSIQSVNANLRVARVDEVGNIVSPDLVSFEEAYPNHSYTFDWYLGTEEQFAAICQDVGIGNLPLEDLQDIIGKLRKGLPENESTERFDVDDVTRSSLDDKEKSLLIRLLGGNGYEPLLASGNGEVQFRFVEQVYAMPYIPDIESIREDAGGNQTVLTRSFCAEGEWIPLAEGTDVPELNVGFPDVDYTAVSLTNVPLRLGLVNLKDNSRELTIPIQNKIDFGVEGENHVLRALNSLEKKKVFLQRSGDLYEEVGELISLFAQNRESGDGNSLTLKFNMTESEVEGLFKEGETYSLYIPFGEYENEDATQPIEGSCEGTAYLQIKIVPEYLTWEGEADAVWYNDNNWNQSTKADLYMGNKDQTDANSDDDVTNAFTPLYFTKITIPENKILNLSPENGGTLDLGTTTNIQYDMAVNNTGAGNSIEVVPYYGNKVDQIYFKPEAKLMNQHRLDYVKAWVEFEIANNAKRWMASPLQDVYAGDIYAPKANGKEDTEAFKDIEYNTDSYSRWTPAFYQKAWNQAIEYATDNEGNRESVAAVQSNWSIEYNDVSVPYTIGKGFYLSVEDVPAGNGGDGTALVRLPKADAVTDYKYEEATKASVLRADDTSKANSGRLVELSSNDSYILTLDKDVDGDGTHFLVGNPFMTYLNMETFLDVNKEVLAPKYWTLANGAPDASVGTPDVDFEGGNTNGTVAPMQAFFVELKSDAAKASTDANITFTPAMMSATGASATEATTKSASATNPVITLTAERGDVKSKASLLTYDKADNGYKADEDAVVLLDSELDAPMVYTVSGSKAAQVNAVKSIRNIGLGVYNETNDEVTLTIEGLSRLAEPLYLYDAHTRKSVKLEDDSYSLQVAGDSHGRYFLRDSELGSELENTISIYSARRGQVIVSSLRPVKEIKVFGLNGSQVRQFSVNTTQYSFDLPAGIYMIHASDGEQAHTEKVIVR